MKSLIFSIMAQSNAPTTEKIFDAMTVLDATPLIWKILLRIGLAIIAGMIIGFEGKSRLKEAGVKTHTLLCLVSCLLIIISKYGFYELSEFDGIQYDASRVASTIISGLCFFGAGMVLYKQDKIQGLTSAVSMCLTIAIGMCYGAGFLIIGGIATVLVVTLQIILHKIDFFKSRNIIFVNSKFIMEDGYIEHFKKIFNIKHFLIFKMTKEETRIVVEVEFYYKVKVSSEELVDIAKNEPNILMIKKY